VGRAHHQPVRKCGQAPMRWPRHKAPPPPGRQTSSPSRAARRRGEMGRTQGEQERPGRPSQSDPQEERRRPAVRSTARRRPEAWRRLRHPAEREHAHSRAKSTTRRSGCEDFCHGMCRRMAAGMKAPASAMETSWECVADTSRTAAKTRAWRTGHEGGLQEFRRRVMSVARLAGRRASPDV